ncbi:unnamed protein product [Brassica oleracea var. botrytis]
MINSILILGYSVCLWCALISFVLLRWLHLLWLLFNVSKLLLVLSFILVV